MSAQLTGILRKLDDLTHALDFDRGGLGEDMVTAVAESIAGQMAAELDPAGGDWPELSEAYAEWKSRTHPGKPISELTGHMRSLAQLRGLARITPREIGHVYGDDDLARDLAEWFQEGSTRQNRPPRPFFKFNEMARERLQALLDRHFAAAVK